AWARYHAVQGPGSRSAQSRAPVAGTRSGGKCSNPVIRQVQTTARSPRPARSAPEEHDMKNNTLAIALASLLVGGVAVAAFQGNRDAPRSDVDAADLATGPSALAADDAAI